MCRELALPNDFRRGHTVLKMSQKVAKSMHDITRQLCGELQPDLLTSRRKQPQKKSTGSITHAHVLLVYRCSF